MPAPLGIGPRSAAVAQPPPGTARVREARGAARRRAGPIGRHDRPVLLLPRRTLLVIAGLPGAGKSTLVNRLWPPGQADQRVVVADPERIRLRWETLLGGRPCYRYWRPVVYVEHYLRLLVAMVGQRPVVLHDTATRRWVRRGLGWLALCSGRRPYLVWLEVTARESLRAQRDRGRTVPVKAMARHLRRADRIGRKLAMPSARFGAGPFVGTAVLRRPTAARLRVVFGDRNQTARQGRDDRQETR